MNTAVMVCIVIAGILVGVGTYKQMNKRPGLDVMDVLVQVVFTIDCATKIFQEGPNALQYW